MNTRTETLAIRALLLWLYDLEAFAAAKFADTPIPDLPTNRNIGLNPARLALLERMNSGDPIPLPDSHTDLPRDPDALAEFLDGIPRTDIADLTQRLADAVRYGFANGVSGFIYHTDCAAFLRDERVEDAFEDWFDEEGFTLLALAEEDLMREAVYKAINPDWYGGNGWSGYSILAFAFAEYTAYDFLIVLGVLTDGDR